ncbi:hypothetical protein [Eubacterium barkeri]|uniref:Uncharacterized protein n=1 Tax=Eubacterium barkeri TaxID=1528 RepID=A0A1H3HDT5_EUBBA|nr:hypothetical protein [Eubacterium barkeri]SDY13676.1 hypothetical protein SAMN04488579_11759 [Eubacterium barkeri]
MKYRIVYDNGGHCTIEAASNLEAVIAGVEKARAKAGRDLKAIYRLSDNGCIAAELDLVAADFVMEGEYEQD